MKHIKSYETFICKFDKVPRSFETDLDFTEKQNKTEASEQ